MSYRIIYTCQAQRDARKLKKSPWAERGRELLRLLAEDSFRTPPPYEALTGDLQGAYSRRINIQHRLVYQVLAEEKIVKVLRLWTHYE